MLMNPTLPEATPAVAEVITKATETAAQVHGVDPIFQGLAWVSGILLAVLAIAKPFMGLIRQYKTDGADSARDDADKATFERQTKQIDKLTADVERLLSERDVWFREATELRARVEKLEGYESSMERMKEKLDEKDLTIGELRKAISERDERIMGLMQELIKTNDRLRELEVRLSKDEKDKCFGCTGKKSRTASSTVS